MKFMMRLVLAMAVASGIAVPASAAHAADCSPARVAAADINRYESTSEAWDLVFKVVATADPGCHPVGTVGYTVEGDTATGGDPESDDADFVPVKGTLKWTSTSPTTLTVSVPVRNDSRPELDERLELHLSDASGLVVTDPVAVGWLRDDDGMVAPGLVLTPASEKICWIPGPCQVRIKFSVPLRAPVTMHYRTHDMAAIAGRDYVGISDAEVTAKTGTTSVLVPINLLRDQSPEPDETFGLEVFAPTGGRAAGGSVPVVIRSGQ